MPEIFRMFGMKFFFYSLEHLRLVESHGIKPNSDCGLNSVRWAIASIGKN